MTTPDRPLGPLLPDFIAPPHPAGLTAAGRFAWVRPLRVDQDAAPLFAQMAGAPWLFDYLGEVAPDNPDALAAILAGWSDRADAALFAIGREGAAGPLGYACLMNVTPAQGDIEIGNVNLSPALQRTPAATEAFSLLLRWCFAAGYRRVTWKCNALNTPSRRAAQRLGFSFEGVFRNHLIVKGRNRDTAWFAMTDADWQGIGPAHAQWLADLAEAPGQTRSLKDLTAPHLVQRDPAL